MKTCIEHLRKGDVIHYNMKWRPTIKDKIIFDEWYAFPISFYAKYKNGSPTYRFIHEIIITKIIKCRH